MQTISKIMLHFGRKKKEFFLIFFIHLPQTFESVPALLFLPGNDTSA